MAADKNIKVTSKQIDDFDELMQEYNKSLTDDKKLKSRYEFVSVILNKYNNECNTESVTENVIVPMETLPSSKINQIKKTIISNCSWLIKNTQYIPTSHNQTTRNKVTEIIESANAL